MHPAGSAALVPAHIFSVLKDVSSFDESKQPLFRDDDLKDVSSFDESKQPLFRDDDLKDVSCFDESKQPLFRDDDLILPIPESFLYKVPSKAMHPEIKEIVAKSAYEYSGFDVKALDLSLTSVQNVITDLRGMIVFAELEKIGIPRADVTPDLFKFVKTNLKFSGSLSTFVGKYSAQSLEFLNSLDENILHVLQSAISVFSYEAAGLFVNYLNEGLKEQWKRETQEAFLRDLLTNHLMSMMKKSTEDGQISDSFAFVDDEGSVGDEDRKMKEETV